MWRGSEVALASYGLVICRQWVSRGYADTCATTIVTDLQDAGFDLRVDALDVRSEDFPEWWGDARLHTSHQASLVRKDASHYRRFFPDVDPELPYWWPV